VSDSYELITAARIGIGKEDFGRLHTIPPKLYYHLKTSAPTVRYSKYKIYGPSGGRCASTMALGKVFNSIET
jgi:hypothetical protein